MSSELYEKYEREYDLDKVITKSEIEFSQTGEVIDAIDAFEELERKHSVPVLCIDCDRLCDEDITRKRDFYDQTDIGFHARGGGFLRCSGRGHMERRGQRRLADGFQLGRFRRSFAGRKNLHHRRRQRLHGDARSRNRCKNERDHGKG